MSDEVKNAYVLSDQVVNNIRAFIAQHKPLNMSDAAKSVQAAEEILEALDLRPQAAEPPIKQASEPTPATDANAVNSPAS